MKTVIEMAREAGFNKNELAYLGDNFLRFAELVRADEREACAKVCDDLPAPESCSMAESSLWDVATLECGDAIRARSNT